MRYYYNPTGWLKENYKQNKTMTTPYAGGDVETGSSLHRRWKSKTE